jgi:alkanesulfonate monooxygenase SsuD/methylene tetrahydromethanopterin reductase-like flavin-dependent oxidoreductase (luciferase family)
MRFGVFSNNRRPARLLGDAWDLDIAEAVAADKAGFDEVWFSEHQSPAELIISKAAGLTSRVLLGSAVRPLAYYHPLQVAIEAAATDHITHGRYQLGVGVGFYAASFEMRGVEYARVRDMVHASIDLILKLFTATEPVDYDGPFWKGKKMIVNPKPIQKPHPPIAVAANLTDSTVVLAAQRGFKLLTSDFASMAKLHHFGEVFDEAQAKAGHAPSRKNLQVCRVVYVADTDKKARDDMRESYNETIKWEIANTPHHQQERIPKGGSFDDINFDYLVDTANLIVGSPETVYRRIVELYEGIGGFGQINFHAGRDYATPEKLAASMTLFGQEVMPRLRGISAERAKAAE